MLRMTNGEPFLSQALISKLGKRTSPIYIIVAQSRNQGHRVAIVESRRGNIQLHLKRVPKEKWDRYVLTVKPKRILP